MFHQPMTHYQQQQQQHSMYQQQYHHRGNMYAPNYHYPQPPSHYYAPLVAQQQPRYTPLINNVVPQQEVNGGISQNLEYDLKTMSQFISWCSFGILRSENQSFDIETSIQSVLFATRLPKSTIIIALEYLNQRFSSKIVNSNSDDVFKFIIISLILANKFNDDNTFTNKSWSGACQLNLQMINEMERQWLEEVKFSLSTTQYESNILVLEECWETYKSKQEDALSSPVRYTHHSPSSSYDYSNYGSNNYEYSNNYYNSSPVYYNYQPQPQPQPIWYDPAIQSIQYKYNVAY